MKSAIAAALLLLQSAASTQAPFVIEAGRVGPVAIGASAYEVSDAFRDRAKLVDLKLEGMLAPALELRLFGSQLAPSLIAEIAASGNVLVITRIHVLDASLRTKDGIGVGSTFGELRARYAIAWISHEEGCSCARVEALRMTFTLDFSGRESLRSVRDPAKLPPDLRIKSIMLTK